MKSPVQVRNKIIEIGAELTRKTEGSFGVFLADAPKGQTWVASPGLHCLRAEWREGDTAGKEDAVNDLWERINKGLETCDIQDCDMCNDY